MNRFSLTTLCFLGLALISAHAAEDPFAANIRNTEALTPEQEQKTFHLPPGFEIELFASEPDIGKPMNMAFDVRGRLWVTQSREYPYAAPLDKPGRDKITILEDRDGDGHADHFSTFVDGLNIPIGLYPFKNEVVAWSIPNIWAFRDTDHDGKADVRQKLYGPLGFERDTHGMNSSFTRGYDGWLYCTHGFNNNTTLRAADGSEIKMNSGNTYRIALDGSHVDQNTWGQVNPFGLCFDMYGNLYSADCHSEPLFQLQRGGYYPSFGKPDDGLGFAPRMIFHDHGSTAISGIIYYSDNKWPDEYQNTMLTGNVMTCRINQDYITFTGTTPLANHRPDFLVCDDPWFRPVNLQMGPDGALYVADFYNRIIGHYEVKLDHPGRDRDRGRIWRIVYKGPKTGTPTATAGVVAKKPSWLGRQFMSSGSIEVRQRINELNSPNLTRRMLSMNHIADVLGKSAVRPVQEMMDSPLASTYQKIHGLWILQRLGALNAKTLNAAATDSEYAVRTHAMRVLAERKEWTPQEEALVLSALADSVPLVRRTAADALGQHPALSHVAPLLHLLHDSPADDTHLVYVTRMALRNQLLPAGVLPHVELSQLSEADARAIANVLVAAPTAESGAWMLGYIKKYNEDRPVLATYLKHAARYVPEDQVKLLVDIIQSKFGDDLDLQLSLFKSIREGTAQRGGNLSGGLHDWGADLGKRLLASIDENSLSWFNTPVEGMAKTTNPWFVQKRKSADGDTNSVFLCSLPPGGEQLTGVLASKPFTIPNRLSFFLAGHDGFPDKPAQKKNRIRLRDASTHEVLMDTFPPRNDTAKQINWMLNQYAGRTGYIEIVDADNGTAYAWLAAGRFNPPVVAMPSMNPSQVAERQVAAADLAQSLSLAALEPQMAQLLASDLAELDARAAAAKALFIFKPNELLASLVPLISDNGAPVDLRRKICATLAHREANKPQAVLADVLHSAPYRGQVKLAQTLVGSPSGAAALLELIEAGQASAQLLLDRSVKDKLSAYNTANIPDRVTKLTKGLTPVNEAVQKLIDYRRGAYSPATANAAEGHKIFTQTCAVCHQIGGAGALVGPQLDGIGNRGLDRIVEDVLDPSRNVDKAFRTHIVVLKDDDVVTGLPRREEGELLVLADSTGKEISIPKKDIKSRRESESSLMPDNFGDAIPEKDFYNLMAFLLSQTGRK